MVPSELKALPQWVVWKLEEREGKPTKVPYRPDGTGLAKVDDSATWGTARQAYELWKADGFNGVGFVLTAADPYCGVDLDHCRDPENGALEAWAQTIVNRFQSYTEITPSRTGLRIWIRGVLPGERRRKGSIELYDRERYFTTTGDQLLYAPATIEDRQQELEAFYAELFPPAPPAVARAAATRTDHEVLDLARKASNAGKVEALLRGDRGGYSSGSEADLALVSLLAFYTQDPGQLERLWRGSGLWREKAEREDYRRRTIDKALAELTETYSAGEPGGEIRSSAGAGQAPPSEPAPARSSRPDPLAGIYSAADLEGQSIPEPRSVVPGVFMVGLNMLAGKGKLGKSWIALDVALAVASGGRALGTIQVDRAEVLYLALEDNQRRMQERIGQLLGPARFPARLHIAHVWPKLDEGGLEALDSWLKAHPQTTFVIVDVWKRIRHKRAKNANLYDEDYEHLVGLQAIAIRHDIAVLVVHHTRKAAAEDAFDEINGSGGVLAALDTCVILHRTRSEADGEIWVTGRDVEEAHLALRFEGGRWSLLGPAKEVAKSKERREVIEAILAAKRPLSPKEVAEALGRQQGAVRALIFKMQTEGELTRLQDATYAVAIRPTTINAREQNRQPLTSALMVPSPDSDHQRINADEAVLGEIPPSPIQIDSSALMRSSVDAVDALMEVDSEAVNTINGERTVATGGGARPREEKNPFSCPACGREDREPIAGSEGAQRCLACGVVWWL